MFSAQINQPNMRALPAWRAIDLLEQHTLSRMSGQERADWVQEMELDTNFPAAVIDDLVRTRAAVDVLDAHDILRTEMLCGLQPHNAAKLRAGLAERRAPRMRARSVASDV